MCMLVAIGTVLQVRRSSASRVVVAAAE